MRAWIRRTAGAGTGVMLALGAGMVLAQSQTGSQNQAGSQAGSDQGQQQPRTIQMVPAQASLNTTLDAKKAKQGEAIKAKLQQNVQIPNEEMLPKNTVLEGHVDQVQASQNKGDSTVVVTFDKAMLKGGRELPIKATVLQVSEPVLLQQEQGGGAPSPGGAAPTVSPQGGGGGGAGGAGASSPAAPSAPAQVDVPEANANPQQQKQPGGVPGVMLTSDIHQQTSATFTSKGKNVHVPDGTQMQLALTVIPAGVKMQ